MKGIAKEKLFFEPAPMLAMDQQEFGNSNSGVGPDDIL
jgi:hypothetical protein